MEQMQIVDTIKSLTSPFFDKEFVMEYLYEKGGDSSCVYICRFKKGRDFFDWREVSGTDEIHLVVFAGGNYDFPSLKKKYAKEYRKFAWKAFFRGASMDEKRVFFADILKKELSACEGAFFGIKL